MPKPWTYANLGVRVASEYQFRSLRDHRGSYARAHRVAVGRPLGYGLMQVIACPEHRCQELIPSENAQDLRPWYEAGRHPRWSLMATLLGPLKQRLGEANSFLNLNSWGRGQTIVEVLKRWPGQGAFIRAMRPHVLVWFHAEKRKYRVPASFATRARDRAFTLRNFVQESDSDLRQIMIGRGVTVARLLQHGTMSAPFHTDASSGLYEFRNQRYLVTGAHLHPVARRYYTDAAGVDVDTVEAARIYLAWAAQRVKNRR